MPGSGTIGGGKSCEIEFTVKDGGGMEKQKWVGTDPLVADATSKDQTVNSCTVTITMKKAYTKNGNGAGCNPGDKFEIVFTQPEKKVVEIEWK